MTAWTLILAATGALFALTVTGCSGAKKPYADYPKECQIPALAQINAEYASELLFQCKDYTSLDDCPNAEEIDARYEKRYDQWEQCATHPDRGDS